MRDPVSCILQMMRNLLIIHEALFNKPNYRRAQTADSIKFINVMFISLQPAKKKQFAFHLGWTLIVEWSPHKTFNQQNENEKKDALPDSVN